MPGPQVQGGEGCQEHDGLHTAIVVSLAIPPMEGYLTDGTWRNRPVIPARSPASEYRHRLPGCAKTHRSGDCAHRLRHKLQWPPHPLPLVTAGCARTPGRE